MRSLVFNMLLAGLSLYATAAGGTPQNQRSVKRLPLDGIPGATLRGPSDGRFLPDRVIVKLMPQTIRSLSKSSFGIGSVDRVLSRAMGVTKSQLFPMAAAPKNDGEVDLASIYVVVFTTPNDPFALAGELSKLPEVQYAEPWFVSTLNDGSGIPNDPLFASQWSLQKVLGPAAWDIAQGDSTTVVAIVDSGVEWTHPDLAANIWNNPGETGLDGLGRDKRSNAIDDDGNGYIDDWHGWDLVGSSWQLYIPSISKGDNDPAPTGSNNEHGTHVAGIVAAVSNNAVGVASIAPRCRILPVKCSADNDSLNGYASIYAGYPGIAYAATMGASIINCSWGRLGGSQFEQDVIDFATQRGSLVVSAAGNDNVDGFQAPASYRGVLSVASTDAKDSKSSFSNYGDYIDVTAPGEGILSTIFPRAYAFLSGTSMASPLTAGIAALVKSRFPAFNGLQVGERVRVTSDNIDGSNPSYAGRLGHGRINALRALQDPATPSVRLQTFTLNDSPGGNGNGTGEPAETLNVICTFRSFLAPPSPGATIQLTSTDDRYITVLQGLFSVPTLSALDSASNKAAPFRVFLQRAVPQSYNARLKLTFTDGSYTDVQYVQFLVNPTYATHNLNAIALTLTNNGRIGFYDFPDNNLGKGFIFNGTNHLFEGGLIVGTSSTQLVDVVRNEGGTQNSDFSSRNFYTLQTPGVTSDQDGFTMFNDSIAAVSNRVGVQVTMRSYAFSNPADAKYVILHYDIKNITRDPIANCYAGLFLDWDLGNYEADYSAYDSVRSLGYCYDSGIGTATRKEYLGVRALDGAVSFRSLVRDSAALSRTAKWDWISGGFKRTNAGPTDIHQVIASGPFTLAPGASKVVGFALIAGDSSLANLQQNSDAAKARWLTISKPVSVEGENLAQPLTFGLEQNYPNPFNPSTSFKFQISSYRLVELRVFDLLGREVATLVNEAMSPGSYVVRWNAVSLPSGVYFYQLRAGSFIQTRKMVLTK